MKKILSLQTLLVMSVALGSVATINAYNETNKYASKETKENNKGHNPKACMKAIEKELEEIKRNFEKNHDAKAAKSKLKAIPAKIKKAVASMKKHSEHGNMSEVHEHTLNRKLAEVKKFVASDEEKPKASEQKHKQKKNAQQ